MDESGVVSAKRSDLNYRSVLIVTYGRSGSTLLQGLLNSIEGCVVRGENYNFCFGLFQAYRSLVRSKGHNESAVRDPFFGAPLMSPAKFLRDARSLVEAQLLPEEHANVRCYGFKEIRYLNSELVAREPVTLPQYLGFLNQLLPRVAFIFLTREHDSVASSGWWRNMNRERVLKQLETFETGARKFSAGRKNCFWISYEEMTAGAGRLQEMFDFLGAPFDEGAVAAVLQTPHSVACKPETLQMASASR